MSNLLEPERFGIPSFEDRAEHVYLALRRKIEERPMGTNIFHFSKIEIEGLMGRLSHRFEGVP